MIKRILLTLLLISPFSFADWGDIYYCEMTYFSQINKEGKQQDYIPQKFKFKLDKEQNAMKFGKSGYFDNYSISLDHFAPLYQSWTGRSDYALARFNKGKFLFSSVYVDNVTTAIANCDKF